MSERDELEGPGHEAFSPRERQALDWWRVPEPPDDFAVRVLAGLEGERVASRGARPLALAALAVVLVGGFFATRLFTGGASPLGEMRLAPGDGGSSVEVTPLGDGVRS